MTSPLNYLRARLPVLAFLVLWIAAFLPTWSQWATLWRSSPQYDFGTVLAVLTLWALVGPRRMFAITPERRWVLPLAAMSLAWLFSWLAGLAALQQLTLVGWGILALNALFGGAQARGVAPAVAWLAFASEIWERAAPPLQSLTVAVVPPFLKLLGLPSVVSGNRIGIPAGEFVVEEGCSGVKFLIALLALACVLLYSTRFRPRHRVALVAIAVAMALLANWFRVSVLIVVGQVTHMRSPMLHDHAMFGWLVFAVSLVPVVLFARRWSIDEPATDRDPPAAMPRRPSWWVLAGLLGPAAAGAIAFAPIGSSDMNPLPRTLPGGWHGQVGATLSDRQAPFSGYESRRYVAPAGKVLASRASWRVPLAADALDLQLGLMHPGNPRAFVTSGRKGEIAAAKGHVIRFSEQETVEINGLRKVTRFWFDVAGRSYAGSAVAKSMLALHAPFDTRFMTITAVETECDGDCTAARNLLDGFMATGL